MQFIAYGEIAFAGNADERFHPLGDQLSNEDLPVRSTCFFGHFTPSRIPGSARELSQWRWSFTKQGIPRALIASAMMQILYRRINSGLDRE